jgi:hypothetical protein
VQAAIESGEVQDDEPQPVGIASALEGSLNFCRLSEGSIYQGGVRPEAVGPLFNLGEE